MALLYLALGTIFGFALSRSGAADYNYVQGIDDRANNNAKLVDVYVAKSDTKLPEYAVWSLISETIDFVVHIDLVRNTLDAAPRRQVTSIVEFGGRGLDGGVRSTEVWGLDDDGCFVQRAPLEQRHVRRLRMAGVSDGLFVPNDGLAMR